MTVLHTGSTKNYSANWGNIFGNEKKSKAAPAKKSAKAKKSKKSKK